MSTTTYAESSAEALPEVQPEPVSDRQRRLVRPMPDDIVMGWLGPLGVTLLAALLRIWRLSVPGKQAFDEVYYACDANSLLRHGVEVQHLDIKQGFCVETNGPSFIVHPHLGKWFIGIGERLFGFNSFGWRISSAIVGTIMVLILCRLGRRLFRSTLLGCLAGLLLTFDGLHFVQSRMAMLDIFVAFWVLAAVACLVVDRDDARRRLADRIGDGPVTFPGPKLGFRWWRLAAGVCLGAGLASKWSALYFVAIGLLLSLLWDVGARRTAGIPAPVRATLWREALPLVGLLIALPGVLYVVSWAGWFASSDGWDRHWAHGNGLWATWRGWWHYQYEIYHFHATLKAPHSYQSHPWGWLFLARPVSYWYTSPQMGQLGCTVPQCSKEVLGIGTPAIWWASVVALGAMIWRWVSRRDWRASFILLCFAAAYLPWFRDDLHQRTMFLFYALPAVPFMCLALAMCCGWAIGGRDASRDRRRWGAIAVGIYLVVVIVNFAGLYPILAAKVIPYDSWHKRMWFSSWI
ncbi:MAG: dolichyl-phosphate-mannose--protein mannosyltransferase [Mycobacteriales bacterium]|nr:phospholipid carrier-dependent glycosyltransferase [Frankia sp.]